MSKRASQSSRPPSKAPLVTAIAVGVVALVGLFGYAVYKDKTAPKPETPMADSSVPRQSGCTPSSVKANIPGVERVPCITQEHVSEGVRVKYPTDPPLSGLHWASWVQPGYYANTQTTERIVHSLEHGHVVIYYDKTKLSDADMDAVKSIAGKFRGSWDGVVAVPRTDPKFALVLTAWEHVLRLEKYDRDLADKFVDAFRGRGPENPVR